MAASMRLYIDVANQIRFIYDNAEESDRPLIRHMARNIATSFERDNPNFSRERFLTAAIAE